ncbi:hypothetical protein Lser_V15G42696 [Lactuca serriola]
MTHLPEEVVEIIINRLTSNRDRNSASLINKLWYTVDRYSRRVVYVANCYALSPERVVARFPMLRSLTLRGKPNISDSRLFPRDWGGSVDPWIEAMSKNCRSLEELRLKRMVVSDRSLELTSVSFPYFKSLILSSCCGFTITGLSSVASNCSMLEQLEVEKSDVTDNSGGEWLSNFPESLSSLVSLNISCIKGLVNPTDLVRLVARSPNLTNLALNKTVTAETIRRILLKAPQLMHLGVGSNIPHLEIQSYIQLSSSFHKCKSIQSLTFFYLVPPMLLRAISPICPNLVHVNMRYATGIQSSELINFIKKCPKLRRLWILDSIGDEGLEVVSYTCKNLEDLRVFHGRAEIGVTEVGLTAISTGCQQLKSLTYFCKRMTNATLVSFSKNCPKTTCFRLIISTPKQPDHTTQQPLDDGLGAIVHSCKNLRKLSLSGLLLTDQVFLYIGMYAEKLEALSVSDAGESDAGMHYMFNGCKNLRKVEMINCPFGFDFDDGDGVCSGLFEEYGSCMRSVWMSSCRTTLGGCKMIAQRSESLNVEVINKEGDIEEEEYPDDDMKVDNLYMYQALDGPRADSPSHIWTL